MLESTVVLLSLIALGGQQNDSQRPIPYGQPTRFEISVDRSNYSVAEPVALTVSLYNDRHEPITGDFSFIKRLWVYHRKVGEEFVRYFPQWLQLIGTGDFITLPMTIPAQGKEGTTERLFYNTYFKRFVLAEPGEYEFRATFQLSEDRLMESNIVRVTVVAPPENEKVALAMLSDPQLASFIEGDLRTGLVEDIEVEAGAEKALLFLEKHSRSLYAAMVEDQLRAVLTEAEARGELTPKLQTLKTLLPDK